jgi:hypothetical protein
MKGIAQVMSLHHPAAAELDVLRDADDGRIYVVDTNPTPWGPPEKLDKSSQKEAIERMADRLKKTIHQARIVGQGIPINYSESIGFPEQTSR